MSPLTQPPGLRQWSSVELRQLSALAAVAEHRSFRLAAESLGYVQSAVSHQIVQLERLAGTRLVERSRGPGRASLTPAGALLLSHADGVFAELRAAQASFAAREATASDRLKLGVLDSAAPGLVPRLAARLAGRPGNQGVAVSERHGDTELRSLLLTGAIHAAIAELGDDEGELQHDPLLMDPYVLVVPTAEADVLAEPGWPVTLLASAPMIGYLGSAGAVLPDGWLPGLELTPHVRLRSAGTATVLALVGSGSGWAVVPRLALSPHLRGIAVVELGDRCAPRRLGLLWHPAHTHPLLTELRMAARSVTKRMP